MTITEKLTQINTGTHHAFKYDFIGEVRRPKYLDMVECKGTLSRGVYSVENYASMTGSFCDMDDEAIKLHVLEGLLPELDKKIADNQ